MAVKGSFTTIKKGRMRLSIRNGYKDDLLRLGIEDINGLLRKSDVQVIDDVDKSAVTSITLNRASGQERIAIKRYDKPTFKRKLKDIFRPSKAMWEWRMGNWLLERGIPAATPLAVGERRRLRVLEDSFLICREIEGANKMRDYISTLKILLYPSLSPLGEVSKGDPTQAGQKVRGLSKEKKEIISSLAKKLKEVHDKGFFHGDLNTSHIMMQSRESAEPAFYFVDFEGSRLGGRLSLSHRVKDLARLNESMPSVVSRTDKLRFFQAYSEGLGLSRKERKKIMRRIETRTRIKKRPFSILKRGGMKIIVRDDYKEALGRLSLENPASLTTSPQAVTLEPNGKATLVCLPIRREGVEEKIILKHHKYRRVREKAREILRRGRAMREWRVAQRLLQIGVGTPLPLAIGQRRRFRIVKDSFFITQSVSDRISLSNYLRDNPVNEKQEILKGVARVVKRAHDAGIFFGDLDGANILLSGSRRSCRYHFIDFESSRLRKMKISRRSRVRELARLRLSLPNLGQSHWECLAEAYIGRDRRLSRRRAQFMRAIDRRCLKKITV